MAREIRLKKTIRYEAIFSNCFSRNSNQRTLMEKVLFSKMWIRRCENDDLIQKYTTIPVATEELDNLISQENCKKVGGLLDIPIDLAQMNREEEISTTLVDDISNLDLLEGWKLVDMRDLIKLKLPPEDYLFSFTRFFHFVNNSILILILDQKLNKMGARLTSFDIQKDLGLKQNSSLDISPIFESDLTTRLFTIVTKDSNVNIVVICRLNNRSINFVVYSYGTLTLVATYQTTYPLPQSYIEKSSLYRKMEDLSIVQYLWISRKRLFRVMYCDNKVNTLDSTIHIFDYILKI